VVVITRNVLIVDDDRDLLISLSEGLEVHAERFRVVTAGDGLAALDTLKEHPIDLVVTDLRMPRMDGLTLLMNIMDNYPEIPVIITTGYSTPQMKKTVMEGGAAEFIEKPFMIEDLARRIISVLEKKSDGGTIHGVSSSMFLQLMQMEQKTCTIRVLQKASGRQGILFFREGELIDARAANLHGEAAARWVSSWDEVSISIQNECPQKERRIQSDLFTILLEGMRLKDESASPAKIHGGSAPAAGPQRHSSSLESAAESAHIQRLRRKLHQEIGERGRVVSVATDESWNPLMSAFARIGEAFSAGDLRLAYIDKGQSCDFILIPSRRATVISVHPLCPRDRILQVVVRDP
jgi:DNA-binding response OmpR family regulator